MPPYGFKNTWSKKCKFWVNSGVNKCKKLPNKSVGLIFTPNLHLGVNIYSHLPGVKKVKKV